MHRMAFFLALSRSSDEKTIHFGLVSSYESCANKARLSTGSADCLFVAAEFFDPFNFRWQACQTVHRF